MRWELEDPTWNSGLVRTLVSPPERLHLRRRSARWLKNTNKIPSKQIQFQELVSELCSKLQISSGSLAATDYST